MPVVVTIVRFETSRSPCVATPLGRGQPELLSGTHAGSCPAVPHPCCHPVAVHFDSVSVCEIAALGGRQRLEADEVMVACSCGTPVGMTRRHARRVSAGEVTVKCQSCKYPRRRVSVTEGHLKWWLERSGCNVGKLTAAEYVTRFGLPDDLGSMAADVALFFDRFTDGNQRGATL